MSRRRRTIGELIERASSGERLPLSLNERRWLSYYESLRIDLETGAPLDEGQRADLMEVLDQLTFKRERGAPPGRRKTKNTRNWQMHQVAVLTRAGMKIWCRKHQRERVKGEVKEQLLSKAAEQIGMTHCHEGDRAQILKLVGDPERISFRVRWPLASAEFKQFAASL